MTLLPPTDFCSFLPTFCALNIFVQGLIAWLVFWGLVGFLAMGYDKSQATAHQWRIREMTLWKIAFIGGALGVIVGEFVFHHKTNNMTFTALVLIPAMIWWFILVKAAGL